MQNIANIFEKLRFYNLIGIGEFSHGINECWLFRFELLKYVMSHTNLNITIYNEMASWQATNIMNDTYIDINTDKPKKTKTIIKYETPIFTKKTMPPRGKLWQYSHHAMESPIMVKIIKYIKKNKNRITIIGIDNETLCRDYDMYKIIISNLDVHNVNFLWAHNSHVDCRKLELFDYVWTKDKYPKLKWRCGYYLKKKLNDKYCIILSQSYEGTNRFNSWCFGKTCEKRYWTNKYFKKSFVYEPHKKYISKSGNVTLYSNFANNFIEFSNSYFDKTNFGECSIQVSKKWNYVLFFNFVTSLVLL